MLNLVRKTLPVSVELLILLRGVSFKSEDELKTFIPRIKSNGTLTDLKSWTKSLQVAMRFSKPNDGLVGRMNLMQRRLIRRELQKKEITTNVGLVIVTVVPRISVKEIAINKSENEFC